MALKTSLVLTGDASSATAALAQTDAALSRAAQEAAKLSSAMAETDRSIARVAAAQSRAAQETAATRAAFAAGTITIDQYNRELLETKTALSLVETEHRATVNALNQTRAALGGTTTSLGAARAGYTNLGRQIQDVTVQLQGGTNIGTIISQQGGQVADAVAQMGGRFAGFASFMAGPLGSVIILVTGLLANQLIPALLSAGNAADEAGASFKRVELGSSGLAEAQTVLGQVFDLTTGKLKNQNEMLILNARLTAINLRADALKEKASSAGTINKLGDRFGGASLGSIVLDSTKDLFTGSGTARTDALEARSKEVGKLLAQLRSGNISRESALQKSEKLDFSGLVVTRQELQQAIIDQASSSLKTETADLIDKSLDGGKLTSGLLKPDKPKKPKKVADRSGELANFGDDEASKIANIRAQFSDLPSEVKKSEQAMRQLDDILADIGRKKGLKPEVAIALRKEIVATKGVINDSLNKPFSDYLEQAQQAVQIDQLLAQGKYAEAEALQVVVGLEHKQVPLSKEQLATVLATVEKHREMALVLRDQQAIIQSQVRAVQDVRGALEATVGDALRGKFSVEKVLSSIGNGYLNITAQKIVEGVFGNTLRALEDQASAISPVKKAGEEMAGRFKAGGSAVKSFADAVDQARARIAGTPVAANVYTPSRATGGPSDNTGGAVPVTTGPEIVVAGNRSPDISLSPGQYFSKFGDSLGGAFTAALNKAFNTRFFDNMTGAFSGALAGAAFGRTFGPGGAAIGGGIGALSGILRGTAAGDAFSGAIESLSTAAPQIALAIQANQGLNTVLGNDNRVGGKLLHTLLGPIISMLFAAKRGSGSVSDSSVSASGNDGQITSSLNTFGGSVQSTISKIAEQFGASVGGYDVGIGRYKDYYQVSRSGSDKNLGGSYFQNKSSNALYDGKDAASAMAAAISDAITDGAIQGISSKVAAALKSNSDIDKAVAEAIKVQDLELALGGIGEEIRRQFKAFEQQAKERLRIAGKYGFDVVAVEKRNAEDRLKLQEKLAKSQVGSLQQLIDDLTAGSLFEGSAVDQRNALLGKIDKARGDANAGVEGAADTLNQLLQQLNTVSKNAYGTTGGFATDRQGILDIARDTIAKANQRVTDAQKTTDPALTETNAQLNESNDQLAKLAAQTGTSIELLKQLVANTKGGMNIADLMQRARLQ